MDRKINIFIGGSTEGLKFAQKVQDAFHSTGIVQCKIWKSDTFTYNSSFLESVTKASISYDFGVFIASNDDMANIRDVLEDIPRDNVVFEYGIFTGTLGYKRTYLLQEEGCKLPSDVLGYSNPSFNRNFTTEQWKELIQRMSENIKTEFNKSKIQLLPSTSLAIGYFNSFVSKVTSYIFNKRKCEESVLKKSKIPHQKVCFKILFPSELSKDMGEVAHVYYENNNYEVDETGDDNRPFPIRFFKNETTDELIIVDIPTTLNAIRPSLELLSPDSGMGSDPDKIKLERIELENFKRTIDYLVSECAYSRQIVTTEWVVC